MHLHFINKHNRKFQTSKTSLHKLGKPTGPPTKKKKERKKKASFKFKRNKTRKRRRTACLCVQQAGCLLEMKLLVTALYTSCEPQGHLRRIKRCNKVNTHLKKVFSWHVKLNPSQIYQKEFVS